MFTDVQAISQYARNNVALAVEHGLISGFPDETFKPQMQLTRAQAAAILYRAYQFGNDNKVGFEGEQSSTPNGIKKDELLGSTMQLEMMGKLIEQIMALQLQQQEQSKQQTPLELLEQISHLQNQLNQLSSQQNQPQPVVEPVTAEEEKPRDGII